MQRKSRILIVEDERAIRTGLVDVFVYHGYAVEAVDDGERGLALALAGGFDLVLLDVMLPGRSGFEICEAIRARDREQAIILLTARAADDDAIRGLALGADDYVTKPFSVAQLVLRVQAVLRRSGAFARLDDAIRLDGGAVIDTRNLSLRDGDAEVRFTRREVDVLQYLAGHGERPVSREELLHKVWGYARDSGIETRTVDIHIARLRRKIEADPKQPRRLVTVRGGGYRLVTESS
ncbi:response regulator transcription factor [Tahibacter soli]|uniref:Response regulator transcription factor n=1 Tax=Tahibacter soli TaxID=2983605 RepID=A0A9X3YLH5_9GAMM|nr:response regulator transcription factor [Tahibacter soli]MDC8014529.1 response regulator transcription factor [Tahibacter soli]